MQSPNFALTSSQRRRFTWQREDHSFRFANAQYFSDLETQVLTSNRRVPGFYTIPQPAPILRPLQVQQPWWMLKHHLLGSSRIPTTAAATNGAPSTPIPRAVLPALAIAQIVSHVLSPLPALWCFAPM